jgi:hypothetical protein
MRLCVEQVEQGASALRVADIDRQTCRGADRIVRRGRGGRNLGLLRVAFGRSIRVVYATICDVRRGRWESLRLPLGTPRLPELTARLRPSS